MTALCLAVAACTSGPDEEVPDADAALMDTSPGDDAPDTGSPADMLDTSPGDTAVDGEVDLGDSNDSDVPSDDVADALDGGPDVLDGDATPDVDAVASDELFDGVWRYDGHDVTLPGDDLAPLWALVGDARFIGLGESVHTSGGFYAAKHRFVRELVENHGVRAVAMETPRTGARVLGDWIAAGVCDDVNGVMEVAPIFPVFIDTHTAAMAQWLCEWNHDHPDDPVAFFGFDVQQNGADRAALVAYVTAQGEAQADMLIDHIHTCPVRSELEVSRDEYGFDSHSYLPVDYLDCLDALVAVRTWLTERRDALVAAAGEEAWQLARLSLVGLEADNELQYWYPTLNRSLPNRVAILSDTARYYDAFNRASEARDAAMAEVFTTWVELHHADDRVAVWAHNSHLAMHHDEVVNPDLPELPPLYGVTMGTILGESLGDDWAPIALAAYDPGLNWPGVSMGHSGRYTGPDHLETRLHGLDEPFLIIDPASPWLGPAGTRVIVGGDELDMTRTWRALVYIDDSPPMESLLW